MKLTNIYVLHLEEGKYYVGKSNNPEERIKQHFNGNGSGWTKKYKPIEIVIINSNCSHFDEDKITKEYMAIYGIDNVRGGTYCQIKLNKQQIDFLEKEIKSSTNLCFKCGSDDHFRNQCKSESKLCIRCHRTNHNINTCYAKTYLDGTIIIEKLEVEKDNSNNDEIHNKIPDINCICL